MGKAHKKKGRITVKEMKFRNDPMIRLYETTQEWLQERGRPVIFVVGIIVGGAVLYLAGSTFFSWRQTKAAIAFAQAYEKYSAPVLDSASAPTGQATKTYSDEKLKWQETAEAFERLAADYSSYYGAIGLYYSGISYLHLDPEKGVQLLQRVADQNDEKASDLARLALAEHFSATGDMDKAIALYQKLLDSSAVLKPAVQLGLARAYEKAGDTERAVEAYFEAAKADRNLSTSSEAEKRLSVLAPDRVKELPLPQTSIP